MNTVPDEYLHSQQITWQHLTQVYLKLDLHGTHLGMGEQPQVGTMALVLAEVPCVRLHAEGERGKTATLHRTLTTPELRTLIEFT